MLRKGQKVLIQYAGEIENGNTFVNTWVNGGPVEVTVGSGEFLPLFELALMKLERGQRTTVHIPASQAYGAYDESNVIRVPKAQIPHADELPVGSFVSMMTEIGQVRVKVAAVEDGEVVFDCNHELAGHDLTFEIELMRDGTETPVEEEAAPHSCGCGCDKLKEQLTHDGCACDHNHDHDHDHIPLSA